MRGVAAAAVSRPCDNPDLDAAALSRPRVFGEKTPHLEACCARRRIVVRPVRAGIADT